MLSRELHKEIDDITDDLKSVTKWLSKLERRSNQSYWGLRKNNLVPHDRLVEMYAAHEAIASALSYINYTKDR